MTLLRHIALMLLALAGVTAFAVPDDAPAAAADSVPRIRLVTFYPGADPFSVFGHTEIRVVQGSEDWYFNYGVFDFSSSGFVLRFALGTAEYMCAALPEKYSRMGMEGRRMVEQELNLTPGEARAVRDYLAANAMPGRNTYRYQYLTDNCSTRPRDIVERALADSIGYTAFGSTMTYREVIAHYAANYAWTRFGIDLALGSALDRPLSTRERMFIPMDLMTAFGSAAVIRNGSSEPLVTRTDVMVDTPAQGALLPPTPWWCSPMAAAIALLLITVALTLRDLRRRRLSRWFDTALFGLYGLTGLLLFFLMFVSEREATLPNYNALWVNPLMLFPAVAVWIPRLRGALRAYHWLNCAVIAAAIALWWALPQRANPAFFPLMALPLLRSAAALRIITRR